MKKFLILLLLLVVVMPNYAQRKNKRGQKMVSELQVRWHDKEGNPINAWRNWDISYHYDANGNQ